MSEFIFWAGVLFSFLYPHVFAQRKSHDFLNRHQAVTEVKGFCGPVIIDRICKFFSVRLNKVH